LRERLGCSQQELADELRCSRSRIAQLEGGAPMGGAHVLELWDENPKMRAVVESLMLRESDFLRGDVRKGGGG
jgi:transcriptional regulator with XRE-family HTH domain